ncbi:hypothetical protein NEUTE2DRAFT_60035 [Neurospora tetrasperma FGSC 2509]|nr:hypothetical protein NEUTE2DRAFT_60035 [Neurospora tetrasperma FGSC 2509]
MPLPNLFLPLTQHAQTFNQDFAPRHERRDTYQPARLSWSFYDQIPGRLSFPSTQADLGAAKVAKIVIFPHPHSYSHLTPGNLSLYLPMRYVHFQPTVFTNGGANTTPHRNMPGPIRGSDSNGNGGNNRYQPYYFGSSNVPLSLRPRLDGTLPVARAAPPARPDPTKRWDKLKNFMPKVGMKFQAGSTVTTRLRRDKAIWYAMMDTLLFFKARHLQTSLREIMDIATDAAIKRKPPVDFFESLGHGDGLITADATLHFLRSVRESHPLSRRLSSSTFAELFAEIVKAREAYLADNEEGGTDRYPVSPLVQAVDRFLTVAWFWDGMDILVKMESEHAELDDDNDETTEEQEEIDSDGEDTPVTGAAAVSSLVADFDGCTIWTLSTNSYVDDVDLFADVDPLTDEAEDEVMGDTHHDS